jgi:hypothetical protein
MAARAELAERDVRRFDPRETDTRMELVRFKSLDAWKHRRSRLREQVRVAAGLWPEPPRAPIQAHVFGRIEREDHVIEKVWFASRPGLLVTGNLYRPKDAASPCPAIACPHGHWKKGRLNHSDRGSVPARCITLARLGAVVFSYDMIGYQDSGQQCQHADPRLLAPQNSLWGIGPLQLQTFNSIRVLDFLQSRPDVDPDRLGVTGASGGGTQTFVLSAVDDRVQAAAPVNMISSIMQGGCPCENARALRIGTHNVEIASLFAPKPLLMVSATGDWTRLTPYLEYPAVRHVYDLFGAANRISHIQVDAPHNYNFQSRDVVYDFMARWLLDRSGDETVPEHDITVPPESQMRVFADGETPSAMKPLEDVLADIKHEAQQTIARLAPADGESLTALTRTVRTGLRHAVASDWPQASSITCRAVDGNVSPADGLELWLARSGRYVRIRRQVGERVAESDSRVWVFAPVGIEAPLWDGAGHDFVRVEPFGTGQAVLSREHWESRAAARFLETFNRTESAETIYDMLTALGFACGSDGEQVGLIFRGPLGPTGLVARALMPEAVAGRRRVRTVIDMNHFDASRDADYLAYLDLPNVRRIGGLRAIAAVAATGPLWLYNVPEHFRADWLHMAGRLRGVEVRITAGQPTDEAIAEWLAG